MSNILNIWCFAIKISDDWARHYCSSLNFFRRIFEYCEFFRKVIKIHDIKDCPLLSIIQRTFCAHMLHVLSKP